MTLVFDDIFDVERDTSRNSVLEGMLKALGLETGEQLRVAFKHMSGKHDQDSHGSWADGQGGKRDAGGNKDAKYASFVEDLDLGGVMYDLGALEKDGKLDNYIFVVEPEGKVELREASNSTHKTIMKKSGNGVLLGGWNDGEMFLLSETSDSQDAVAEQLSAAALMLEKLDRNTPVSIELSNFTFDGDADGAANEIRNLFKENKVALKSQRSQLTNYVLEGMLNSLGLKTEDQLRASFKHMKGKHDQETHGSWADDTQPEVALGYRSATPEDNKRLGIPPAWTDVNVATSKTAALQAVGKDAKGRRQSIYSADHHETMAAEKFARIQALHEKLPEIDKKLAKDAKTNDTALAALLIRRMGLRPGSDADTKADKKAHGATNLLKSHVTIKGDTLTLKFTGKKGVDLNLSIEDKELTQLVKKRMSGDGRLLDTTDRKLRPYLKDIANGVNPKDFRTYLATAEATELVDGMKLPKTKAEYTKARKEVGTKISEILGNTPTMALSSYIAPSVFSRWDEALG